jgi:hypothetical protein
MSATVRVSWILSRDVGAFVAIAVKAGQRKIRNNGVAPVLKRNDVIDVKR